MDLKYLSLCLLRSHFAQLKCLQNLGYWRVGVDIFLNYGMGVGGEGMKSAENGFFRNVQLCLCC